MYIAQLIDSLSLGGAQILLKLLAEELLSRRAGHRLAVLSLGFNTGSTLPEELEALGVHVFRLPTRRLLELRQIVRLAQIIRRERFDVLHTHLPRAHILGAALGRLSGVPVVSTLHSTGEERRHFNPWRYRLETLALRYGARQVLAVGESVRRAHAGRLRSDRVRVLPNAVRPVPPLAAAERLALRSELLEDAERPFIITVGRLLPPKAYPDLLQAMRLIAGEQPRAFLAVVGGGDLRVTLEAQARRLGLAAQVRFLGQRGDVPRLLAAADVYVSSSQREGVPLAVLEAMSAGLPVVATEVGDLPYLLAEGRGLLVPVHDPSALAAAVSRLLADAELRRSLGRAGQAYVLREHAPDVWVNRLLEMYAAL